jgi:hypothetical protein
MATTGLDPQLPLPRHSQIVSLVEGWPVSPFQRTPPERPKKCWTGFTSVDEHVQELSEQMSVTPNTQPIFERSALESIIKDALASALQSHTTTSLQQPTADSKIFNHNEDHDIAAKNLRLSPSHDSISEVRLKVYSKRRGQSSQPQILHQSKDSSFFIHIDIKKSVYTTSQRCVENDDDDKNSCVADDSKQMKTTLHIQSKPPLLSRGIIIQYARPTAYYDLNLGFNLTMYNIVSEDSAVFKAAKRLDLRTMRSLFDAGLASSRDRGSRWGRSPLDVVMDELLRQSWITSCQISESVDLVGFLPNTNRKANCGFGIHSVLTEGVDQKTGSQRLFESISRALQATSSKKDH